jgi:hypothetical protein
MRCFGVKAVVNLEERSARFLEESVELCQAVGLEEEAAISVVKYVYARPTGEVPQEVGGVAMTLGVLVEQLGLNFEQEAYRELMRCCERIEAIREKHNKKPKFGVLPS